MNPYLLDLPAVVSFSGGRTSGFMLRQILDAHGGRQNDLAVCFQNTGLEHPATYAFVERIEKEWNIHITWLEYHTDSDGEHAVRSVSPGPRGPGVPYSTGGEPFSALNQKKGYLPNPVARVCTTNLKMRTLDRYIRRFVNFKDGYTNAIGLRYDEPRRVHRIKSDNSREDIVCPMYDAKHTEADVLDFWRAQPFDLELPLTGNMAGNCVGCFLKSRHKLEILMEEMPEHFDWWIEAERLAAETAKTEAGKVFRTDRPSYATMMETNRTQGRLFPVDDTLPCHCTD